MEQSVNFCIVWKIELPVYNTYPYRLYRCSNFFFQTSLYYLQLSYTPQNCYKLFLHRADQSSKSSGSNNTFDVTIIFEKGSGNKVTGVGSFASQVQSTPRLLWKFTRNEIFYDHTNFYDISYTNGTKVKIMCIFHDDPQSGPQSNTMSSTKNVFDLPPNLESLSLDLSSLLKDETFQDVKIKCGKRTISAHRSVLSARSEVFAAMFRNKMKESKTGTVDVADIDDPVIDLFFKYLYSGKVTGVSDDTVPGLYAAADKYAVLALKDSCCERMVNALTENNCIHFLTVADAHSDVAFKNAVVSFICSQEDILESDAWLKFSKKSSELAMEVYQSFVRSKSKRHKLV